MHKVKIEKDIFGKQQIYIDETRVDAVFGYTIKEHVGEPTKLILEMFVESVEISDEQK